MRSFKLMFVLLAIPVLLIAYQANSSYVLSQRPFVNPYTESGQSASVFFPEPRPILSGPVYYRYKPHLIVHYTTSGIDSTTPAYAESIAVFAETCWARVIRLGWYPPAPDPGRGTPEDPDTRFDIFLTQGCINVPDSAYTNPYPDGYSAFNLVGSSLEWVTYDTLRAFVAHEFHHSCQARCSNFEGIQMYEMTSTYMVEVIFPNTSSFYWGTAEPPSPLIETWYQINSLAEPLFRYKNGLWMKFIHENYGQDVPRQIWDLCGWHHGGHPYWDTDSILRMYYDSDLEEALGHYAIWRYFTGSRDDGQHFYRGDDLHTANLHAAHSIFPVSGNQGTHPPRGPGGMNLIEFTTDGTHDMYIQFNGEDGFRWRAYAVAVINQNESYMQPIILNANWYGAITIPAWMTRKVVLIPVVVNWFTLPHDSTLPLSFTYNASLVSDQVGLNDKLQSSFLINASSQNPVGSQARITYSLPKGIKGNLIILDVKGRLVQKFELVGDGLPAKVIWKRTDRTGKKVSPGIYFYRLSAGANTIRNKIIVE